MTAPLDEHGLLADLQTLRRRHALALLAAAPLTACAAASVLAATADGKPTNCPAFPREMVGPYPGDGSNRGPAGLADALSLAGIERPDIRNSVGGARLQARGVPLQLQMKLVDSAGGCAPLAGWTVYVWQCDAAGRYSLYHADLAREDHLRGVQSSDAEGQLSFTTLFPGCYPGRMPHIHFQLFAPGARAPARLTSQMAFAPDLCTAVYRLPDYADSVRPFSTLSFARDWVFRDGVQGQMAATRGDPALELVATLEVALPR